MPMIDGQRVVADLKRLAEFGRYKTGVHRPTYSPVDVESRPRLARTFAADPGCAELGIEVTAWADEEGHYESFLGSRSFTGALTEEQIDQVCGRDDGTPLRGALRRAGFAERPREPVDPGRYVGYLEAHIEQGDTLDTSGLRIGVVETIVGIWNYRVTLDGEQNHAGTTRMVRRKDAGVAMVRLATRIHERFPEIAGPATVWTIGRMLIEPNAPSVIPGHAEMQVQI